MEKTEKTTAFMERFAAWCCMALLVAALVAAPCNRRQPPVPGTLFT